MCWLLLGCTRDVSGGTGREAIGSDAPSAFRLLMASSPHRDLLLSPRFCNRMGRSSVVVGSSCRRRACGMLNTVPLWAHQRAEIDASWSVPARARLWEPRLGKTRVCAVEMRRLWEG